MEPILSVRELTKTFSRPGQGKQTAVNGVSFDLRPGERLGIIGESGSGKTTVANLVTRLLDADGGRILLDGEDITSVTGRDLRRVYRKIQMVFQTPAESFDPRRTLGDGVGESLRGLEGDLASLFICHDISLVQQFCHRVLVMHRGEIVEQGTPDEVICRPQHVYTRHLIDSVL